MGHSCDATVLFRIGHNWKSNRNPPHGAHPCHEQVQGVLRWWGGGGAGTACGGATQQPRWAPARPAGVVILLKLLLVRGHVVFSRQIRYYSAAQHLLESGPAASVSYKTDILMCDRSLWGHIGLRVGPIRSPDW